jgi:hypothetical protein
MVLDKGVNPFHALQVIPPTPSRFLRTAKASMCINSGGSAC